MSKRKEQEEQGSGSKKALVFLLCVVLPITAIALPPLVSMSNMSNQQGDGSSGNIQQEIAAQEAERARVVDEYAPQYCENRQEIKLAGMPEGYPVNDGSGWTPEECRIIIGKVHDYTRYEDIGDIEEEIERVTTGKYWVGMSEIALLYSLGDPSDINTTRTQSSVSKQYVYGDPLHGAVYIYTEDGEVTTVQS